MEAILILIPLALWLKEDHGLQGFGMLQPFLLERRKPLKRERRSEREGEDV